MTKTRLFKTLILIFLGLCPFFLKAQKSPLLVSGEFVDTPISEILKSIKNQWGVRFAYDAVALSRENATIEFQLQEIDQVLLLLFKDRDWSYRKVGSTYVIVPLERESPSIDSTGLLSIKVVVLDATSGEPLPFAVARVLQPIIYGQSDVQGVLVMDDIPSDTCQIIVSYVGYEQRTVRVSALLREKKPAILLQVGKSILPTALVEGKAVSPVKSTVEAGLQVINPQVLGGMNGPGQSDVLRTAQLIPGVNATNESSNGLIIRGSAGDQSLLIIDGFTVYHMDHLFGMVSAINPLAVKNIRIQKGGAEARFATRAGGLVEITAKEGSRYESGGKIELGPLWMGGYLETPLGASNKGSLMISGRRSIADIWKSPPYKELFNTIYDNSVLIDDRGEPAETADYVFGDLMVKTTWRPSEKDLFFLSGYFSSDQLSIDYSTGDNAGIFNYSYSDNVSWGNRGLGAGWSRDWSKSLSQELNLGWSTYRSELDAVDTLIDLRFRDLERVFREERNLVRDFTAKYQLLWRKGNRKYYTGLHLNAIDVSQDILEITSQSSILPTLFAERKLEKRNFGYSVGGRITYNDLTSEIYPEWRINAFYGSIDSVVFKVAITRVHQFVHRVRQQSLFLNQPDLWLLSGGNNLPVLISDQFILGAVANAGEWQMDVEGYLKLNQGVSSDFSLYQWLSQENESNIISGNGYSIGMDVMLKKDGNGYDFWLAYSISHTRTLFDALDQLREVPPFYDQLHELKIYYEYKWRNWSFWSTWIFGSGRPYTPFLGQVQMGTVNGSNISYSVFGDINSARIDPYHRLDLGVGYTWNRESLIIECRLTGTNVYNRNNIRDIQFLSIPNQTGQPDILQRDVGMIGFVPGLQLNISF